MKSFNAKEKRFIKLLLAGFLISLFLLNSSNLVINEHSIKNKSIGKENCKIISNGPLTPSGIRITAINDSSNSLVITWYTLTNASDPKIIYSTDPNLMDSITIIPSLIYIDNTYNSYIYSANLRDLESNTSYYYKISSDVSNERNILNFTTLKPRNATSSKFLLFGDSRSQPEQRNELVKKIIENFDDIDFTIHTGDIVEDGRDQTQWNEYFNDVEILTKFVPGYYIEGNHEQQSQFMYDNIPLPSNVLNSYYYNFSVGPISFLGLNTERDISEQTSWLEKTLKIIHQDNDTLWKTVFMHQPFFNSRSTRPDRTDLITAWGPLFEKYNVDFVFAGHNHYYERSYPMNFLKQYDNTSSYYFENQLNPMYFITGGAGAPLYTRDTNPDYAPFYNSTYHFIIAEVTVDDLQEETFFTFETWAMPKNYSGIYLIDNLTVVKKGAFVNIHKPTPDQLYGKNAPYFNVSIDKLKPTWFNLNSTWYSINNGKTNFTYNSKTGTINQTAWDFVDNGIVKISFYANDSLGKIIFNAATVRKDTIPPNISIFNPTPYQLFGQSALNFSLIIDEPHLNLTWYTLDEGKINYTFTVKTGTINHTIWDNVDDGIVKIIFYANDSVGNLGYKEIEVRKDSIAPMISILSPFINETFGVNAPNFTVVITDLHLDSMWYIFNESDLKFTFNSNSTINQEEWESLSNGAHKLIFYANDSIGNVAMAEILIYKNVINDDNAIDMTSLLFTVTLFIFFFTIGLTAYVYIYLKRLKFKG